MQGFVWVQFFEARFGGFRRSQIKSCKKRKKKVHMSSSWFVPARGFFQAFIPRTYLCLLICLHQHIAPSPPTPTPLPRGRACLMSAGKNVLSPTKLVQTLCRKGPFGRLTTSSPCNVVPLFELPVENNKHPNFEWRGVGGLWIEKNCLNAEVYATLKYNWLVPLAGSLVKGRRHSNPGKIKQNWMQG